jgi:HK97 family phage prohead protease
MSKVIELVTERTKLIEIMPERAKELAEATQQKPEDIELVRKGTVWKAGEMKIDEGERAAIRYVSTANLDRDGEILLPNGADLKRYRKNPVVLFGHDYHNLPIGKDLWIKVDEKGVIAKTQYAKTAFADEVYELVKDGMLRTSSVGFIPTKAIGNPNGASWWYDKGDPEEWEKVMQQVIGKWGIKEKEARAATAVIQKWELLEHSDVPVPSNPNAVNIMVGKGFKFSDKLREGIEAAIVEDDAEEVGDEGKTVKESIRELSGMDEIEKELLERKNAPDSEFEELSVVGKVTPTVFSINIDELGESVRVFDWTSGKIELHNDFMKLVDIQPLDAAAVTRAALLDEFRTGTPESYQALLNETRRLDAEAQAAQPGVFSTEEDAEKVARTLTFVASEPEGSGVLGDPPLSAKDIEDITEKATAKAMAAMGPLTEKVQELAKAVTAVSGIVT